MDNKVKKKPARIRGGEEEPGVGWGVFCAVGPPVSSNEGGEEAGEQAEAETVMANFWPF